MNNRPKKGYGFIYKYTSPSGKNYIGQTILSLKERAGHNGKNYKGCPIFYQAIKKYGLENFDVTILAEAKKELLDSLEIKYITIFNTMKPNGYNSQAGGKSGTMKPEKTVYQYDKNTGKLLNEFLGLRAAAEANELNIQALSVCLKGLTLHCGDFCWSYQKMKKYPAKEALLSPKKKKVIMYDLKGNLLKEFDSVADAAKAVGGVRNTIKQACRKEIKSAYGYKWSCSEIIAEKKYNNTAKQVYKLDKDTNEIIEVFPSISAAARSFGKETSFIRRVLDRENYTAYGFKWKTAQGSTTKGS